MKLKKNEKKKQIEKNEKQIEKMKNKNKLKKQIINPINFSKKVPNLKLISTSRSLPVHIFHLFSAPNFYCSCDTKATPPTYYHRAQPPSTSPQKITK